MGWFFDGTQIICWGLDSCTSFYCSSCPYSLSAATFSWFDFFFLMDSFLAARMDLSTGTSRIVQPWNSISSYLRYAMVSLSSWDISDLSFYGLSLLSEPLLFDPLLLRWESGWMAALFGFYIEWGGFLFRKCFSLLIFNNYNHTFSQSISTSLSPVKALYLSMF